MKRSGFLFFLLLSLLLLFGASLMAQEAAALLLFARYNEATENRELYVVNADTGEERFVSSLVGYADAGWSPDGRIWLLDDDGTERRLRFFDAETLEESAFGESLHLDTCFPTLDWSPNGEYFAYVTGSDDELFTNIQNIETGTSYQIPVRRWSFPFWSPDGNYFMLSHIAEDWPVKIYRTSDGEALIDLETDTWTFSFSPDSRYLAQWDWEDEIYIHELETGEIDALPYAGEWAFPAWSLGSRYLSTYVSSPADSLNYYDMEDASIETIDLGKPIALDSWSEDDTRAYIATDYIDSVDGPRPTTLLAYHLETGETETIIEGTSWIGGVYPSGDWLAIRYSFTPPEDHFSPTSHILFWNGESQYETELLVGDGWFRSSTSSLPERRGFLIDAVDGLYHFDSESASLEAITLEDTGYSLWTADGAYIAFVSVNMPENPNTLNIWSIESKTFSVSLEEADHPTIIGWQGSMMRESLLFCGEG